MDVTQCRPRIIHKAEYLDERKLMLQWWADFLDANREKGITPFDYAKINRGNGK
ncbi:putative integrase [Escherichia coli Jurua 18/11]|nr:putative integrase [Escherichia coli BCE034_MS-14]EMW15588.1 putative integrase [Escherichia coli 2845650]EMW76491.1 putative integrase [Escherichia coli 180600]EMW97231.1 putative integrase [Escherichia coli P0304777.1]EMX16949.1 putative integrase [Escherichia coli P0301867.1]EMX60156.1 putative integrase [Escherichia coli Jurua 18/11]EMZ75582.1 putative integrase [Escherichia coli 199900.1]ENA36285.1 putative integrase [Escherichia coli P0301867.4]ENA42478.1 putative integrase [Escher